MTVIASTIHPDGIVMACDSQQTRGSHYSKEGNHPKVIRGQDFLIGACGDSVIIPLLSVFAKTHRVGNTKEIDRIFEFLQESAEYVKKKTGNWMPDCELILGHKSGLFLVQNWLPLPKEYFVATGSGYIHAETAMHLGHSARDAVQVAIDLSYGCGGEILKHELAF